MLSVEILLVGIILLLIGVPSILLFLELILGQVTIKSAPMNIKREACVILIPAHNEETVIGKTLEKLKNEAASFDRVLVVADNCTDSTVAICKKYDIEVIERTDKDKIGKGYALDFGIQHLKNSQFKTVVILDADCEFTPGSLDMLVKRSQYHDKIVQSMDLMKAPPNPDVKTRLAEFGWLVKNRIRPTGMVRLGISCQLQGTGMAFPLEIFDKVSLASANIVEDLELSLKLANIGEEVLFENNAVVISYFPSSIEGAVTQRMRWEHGRLSAIYLLPQMMLKAILNRKANVFWLALDAAIPPTILWLIFVLSIGIISTFLLLFSLVLPSVTIFFCFILLSTAIFISWLTHARDIVRLKDILGALKYIFSKFPIYSTFITFRQKDWIRTKRNK